MLNQANQVQEVPIEQPAPPVPTPLIPHQEEAKNEIDVAPILVLNQLNNFLHLEILEDDLMNEEEMQMAQNEEMQVPHEVEMQVAHNEEKIQILQNDQ